MRAAAIDILMNNAGAAVADPSSPDRAAAAYLEIKSELADATVAGVDVNPERDVGAQCRDRWVR